MGSDGTTRSPTETSWLYRPVFPESWDRHVLYSLATWINGMAFKNINFSPTGRPVIKIAEIKNGITEQTQFTDSEYDQRYFVTRGEMLFSWSGQPETSIDAFFWDGPDGWLNQHVFKVLPNTTVCTSSFLYYVLKYLKPNFIGIARNKQTTGLGHVTKADLEAIQVAIPDRPTQDRITHVLGKLDARIAVNRRMNRTLENIARALFKSWFVDFDPVRRNMERKGRGQPSPGLRPPSPTGRGVGGEGGEALHYRGGYDFAGLVETARELRKKQTPAEAIFWELARDRRLMGVKFRRQHQLGDYVADFYCHEHRLVIEFDGGIHAAKHAKDHKRDAWMRAKGFKVLRFPNEQLLDNPESVLTTIADTVCGLKSPLPLGEGWGEGSVEELDRLFPDTFEDSPLGPIPLGWAVRPLSDVLHINPTRLLRKGTVAPYLEMGNMPTRGPSPEAWVMREMGSGTKFVNGDTLVARITPCLENGKTAFVDFLADGQVGWGSTEYIVLRPKGDIPPVFAYLLARTGDFRSFAIQQMTGSSGRQRVPADSLTKYSIVGPEINSPIFRAFAQFVTPLFRRISAAMRQSRNLARMRDTLLPKLLSGEIELPAAEAVAEGVQ